MTSTSKAILLPLVLMLVFAVSRWPGWMPENFSAAYALAFCGGVYFSGRMAWWLPLGTLLVTCVLLNLFHYDAAAFNRYTLFTMAGFALIVGLGRSRLFSPRSSIWKLVGGGLLGAVIFYLVTNTASWIYEPTQPYPRTLQGWLRALTIGTAGWPETWTFFRNTLLSSGLFTALFAGAMKLGVASDATESPAEKQEKEEAATKEREPGAEPEGTKA